MKAVDYISWKIIKREGFRIIVGFICRITTVNNVRDMKNKSVVIYND